jgi:hypothetical protein
MVVAHQVAFEKEIHECASSPTGCYGVNLPPNNPYDSSFENPQDQLMMPGDSPQLCHNLYSILNSQSIFGYLNSADDFDVYNYNITSKDYAQGQRLGPPFGGPSGVFIFALVAPQACDNSKNVYFSLALVVNPFQICTKNGPLPPTDYATLPPALSQKLAPNKTVLVVTDSGNRHVYAPPYLDIQWYLPNGCQVVQLPDGTEFVKCTGDAAYISAYACHSEWRLDSVDLDPVQIQFVVFGDGPHDYTLSIGISDSCRVDDMSLWALLKNNRHLVNGCDSNVVCGRSLPLQLCPSLPEKKW